MNVKYSDKIEQAIQKAYDSVHPRWGTRIPNSSISSRTKLAKKGIYKRKRKIGSIN